MVDVGPFSFRGTVRTTVVSIGRFRLLPRTTLNQPLNRSLPSWVVARIPEVTSPAEASATQPAIDLVGAMELREALFGQVIDLRETSSSAEPSAVAHRPTMVRRNAGQHLEARLR